MTESSHPSGPIFGRFPVRLVFELAIVFLGVYGAFWAESVRERREQEQTARSIYAALAEEIRDHVVQGQLVLDEYLEAQTEWERRVDRGESRPRGSSPGLASGHRERRGRPRWPRAESG